jgi:transposase InsO family protein
MMRLHRYDVTFQYVQGTQLFIADTLSRAYLPDPGDDVCVLAMHALADVADKTRDKVREATEKDCGLQTLLQIIDEGWPEKKSDVPESVRMYFDVRDTLSQQEGIILKGERILIPLSLRVDMTKRLHAAHLGYDSMLRRARELMYWPGMAQDIKQMADNCEACQRMKPCNQKETLQQHDDGRAPWMKIGTDLFEIQGRQYLVTVDYFSTYIEVDYLKTTTARDVITKLQGHFARYGVPAEIVSDQGPQYTSAEFRSMTEEWGIIHTMSSPGHHQSNGKAEAAVKTVKHMMYKCLEEDGNQYEALLELRNTPRQDTGLSPAQMMFGRRTRSRLPTIDTKPVSPKQVKKAVKRRRNRQKAVKRSYDKRARDLIPLRAGQPVFFQHVPGQRWKKGVVRNRDDERSYTIEGDNGGVYQRNRVQLRPTSIRRAPDPEPEPLRNTHREPPPATPETTQAANPATTRPAMTTAAENELAHDDDVVRLSDFPMMPSRPQRERKKPRWLEDFVTNF